MCTLAFAGCFHINEILNKKETSFDPDFTLLKRDVVINLVTHQGAVLSNIQVLLKSPKEDRVGRGKIIDVYQNDGPICPVRAIERWFRLRSNKEKSAPLFRFADGSCLTGKKLNKLL